MRVRTERLILETLTADEAAAIRADDRRDRHWADDYPTDGDRVVAGIIGEAGEHYDESTALGVLQMRLASTGEAVGGIGFLSAPDADGVAEVGYGIAESVRGNGYATEALLTVIGWAAGAGVRTVEAITDPDNLASQRVLLRCGFEQTDDVVDGDSDEPDRRMLRWLRPLR